MYEDHYRFREQSSYMIFKKTDLGSSTNGLGYFELNNPKAGDYVLANTSEKIGIEEEGSEKGQIDIYPNPSQGKINIRFRQSGGEKREVRVNDAGGKTIYQDIIHLTKNTQEVQIALPDTAVSFVTVSIDGLTQKVLIR
ncbi:MAG: T9SS type A sorting domain-containing protein [Owenweeksia sp.]